jgi:DNA polymerase II large subunit
MDELRSIYHRCEECDQSFRSTIVDVPCPACGGASYRVTLDAYDISVITSMATYAPDEILRTLSYHIWFSYDKETLQACWNAIDALQDSTYDGLKQFFEDHYHQANTSDRQAQLESIIIDQWENQQEVHLLC